MTSTERFHDGAEIAAQQEELLALLMAQHGVAFEHAPNITPHARDGSIPASFAQQRLWFLEQYEPGSPAYNVPDALHLRGPLQVDALERGINAIVQRHEVLRTTFATVDEQPVQIIAPTLLIPLPLIDLQALSAEEREAQARRLATEEAHRSFDLEHGPLVYAKLLRLAAEEHVLLLTMHHIVTDGWSFEVFFNELAQCYTAFVRGAALPLPDLPIQYADYALWQREWLSGAILEEQLGYWKAQLGGALPILNLPSDRPRPEEQTFNGATFSVDLPTDLSRDLAAFSQREGATLFMTLLTGFNVLISRYSGEDDILVGTPIANRSLAEIEGLIGFFVNTLVVRSNLGDNPSLRALLQRVREACLGAYAHQDLPFEKLVEELHPERDLSRSPVFQTMFSIANAAQNEPALDQLIVKPLEIQSKTAKFDLSLEVEEQPEGLRAHFEYNTDLFEAQTIRRMSEHFVRVLEALVANPDQTVQQVRLLSAAERQQALVSWNQTYADFPRTLCMHQLVEQQAAQTPDGLAVVSLGEKLTYAELDRRANQVARHLRSLGVLPGARVGLCMPRTLEMVVGFLGILKAGAAYVPLDPTLPKDRITYILQDANAVAVLTYHPLLSILPKEGMALVPMDTEWDKIAEQPDGHFESGASAEDGAYVIYTSGSTGKPKGVLVSHRSLVNHNLHMIRNYGYGPQDRILQFASISFDVASEEIFAALACGATLVLRLDQDAAFLADFTGWMEQEQLTALILPASYWHEWVSELARNDRTLPPTIRLVIVGSEAVRLTHYDLWRKVAGEHVRWVNAYGPTEATITATSYDADPAHVHRVSAYVPIGRPIANLQVYILDSLLDPVPVGIEGEIYIGGEGVALGYLNLPELTNERFISDPFSEVAGARLYKSGDRARYLADGTIEFLRRIDNQVKIRGFRIELGEIEAALSEHPSLTEVAVIAREDTPGEKRLVAYMVPAEEPAPTSGELRRFLRTRIPDYMIPSIFVSLAAMPVNASGKIDRNALPAPDAERPELDDSYVAARTPSEQKLVEIWTSILNLARIGIYDNFFELGGHSLLATRVISRIRDTFRMEVSLRSFFKTPTIAELGQTIDQALNSSKPPKPPTIGQAAKEASRWSPLVTIHAEGSQRPLFFVHPIGGNAAAYVGLAAHLPDDQPVYALQSRGLDGMLAPLTSIQEMAESYVNALKSVQSEGPYRLGGWSMGGLVALEMAQQLDREGQEVELLALFDVWIPTEEDRAEQIDLPVVAFAVNIGIVAEADAQGFRQAQAGQDESAQLLAVLERGKAAGLLSIEMDLRQLQWMFKVFLSNLDAMRTYRPQDYMGLLTLFRAAERSSERDPAKGWNRIAAAGLTVYDIAGNHYALLSEPHVRQLASALQRALRGEHP